MSQSVKVAGKGVIRTLHLFVIRIRCKLFGGKPVWIKNPSIGKIYLRIAYLPICKWDPFTDPVKEFRTPHGNKRSYVTTFKKRHIHLLDNGHVEETYDRWVFAIDSDKTEHILIHGPGAK